MVVFLIGAALVPGVVVRLVVVEELLVPLVEYPVWKLASIPVLKTLSLPSMPMCCIHSVWLLCDNCCPSEGIDLYGLVFCRLLC